MKILAFAPKYNTPGKKDATGAFIPEGEKFLSVNGSTDKLILIDNKRGQDYCTKQIMEIITSSEMVCMDAISFFCHGIKSKLLLGIDTPSKIKLFSESVTDKQIKYSPKICLYACSTGGGPNFGSDSFADKLRDSVCQAGSTHCAIFAHSTAGHTTMNPNALFFYGMGSPIGGLGGIPIVGKDTLLWKKWCQRMRDPKETLRYKVPFMSIDEVHKYLLG